MIESKKTVSQVFDKVFVINLPKYWERKIRTVSQLRSFDVQPEIIEGVFGYDQEYKNDFEEYAKSTPGDIDDFEYKEIEVRQNRLMIESPGSWGYLLTYEKILQKAIDENLDRILVFDDDVLLHYDFENEFSKFINSIDQNWKVIQLGASQYGWETPRLKRINGSLSPFYYPAKVGTCGSFAVGIDKSVFTEILEEVRKMRSSFDNIPLGNIYKKYGGKCFVAFPNIIMPDVSSSVIRDGRDQFAQSELMRWEVENYPVFEGIPRLSLLIQGVDKLELLEKISLLQNQDYKNHQIVLTSNKAGELIDEHKVSFLKPSDTIEKTYLDNLIDLNGDYIVLLDNLDLINDESSVREIFERYLLNEDIACSIKPKCSVKDSLFKHKSFLKVYKNQKAKEAALLDEIIELKKQLKNAK